MKAKLVWFRFLLWKNNSKLFSRVVSSKSKFYFPCLADIPIFNTDNKHQSNLQYFLCKLMWKLNDKINHLIYYVYISSNLLDDSDSTQTKTRLITKITWLYSKQCFRFVNLNDTFFSWCQISDKSRYHFYFYINPKKFYIWDGTSTIKCLFWNANGSVVKLMVSIISGVSLWYRPCYKNMLNYDNSD